MPVKSDSGKPLGASGVFYGCDCCGDIQNCEDCLSAEITGMQATWTIDAGSGRMIGGTVNLVYDAGLAYYIGNNGTGETDIQVKLDCNAGKFVAYCLWREAGAWNYGRGYETSDWNSGNTPKDCDNLTASYAWFESEVYTDDEDGTLVVS